MEPQKALQRKLKTLKKEEKAADDGLRQAKAVLQEKRQEIMERAGSAESEQAQRTKEINDLEEQLNAATEKKSELKQAVTDCLQAYEEIEPHVQQAQHNLSAAERRLHAIQSRIRELESSNSSSLAMFGQRCGQVKKSVSLGFVVVPIDQNNSSHLFRVG